MQFNTILTEVAYNSHLQFINNTGGKRLDLRGADLRGADLRGADLRGADLRGANLQGANLRGADLRYANLQGADLRDANLQDADLRYANLQGADLRGADLQYAGLQDADLEDADLRGADLRNCIGNNKEVKSLQLGTYTSVIYLNNISIGCKKFTREEWFSFDDLTIEKMNIGALDWWRVYKPVLQMICEANPVEKEKK